MLEEVFRFLAFAAIAVMFSSGVAAYFVVVQLVKRMWKNDRAVWERHGRPGTQFFKGDEDNGWGARTVAFQQLFKSMWSGEFRQQLKQDGYDPIVQRFVIVDLFGKAAMVLGGIGVLVLGALK
jgi:hypothetical protein